jgi:hypothetical protein
VTLVEDSFRISILLNLLDQLPYNYVIRPLVGLQVSRPIPSAMFCSGINGIIHIAAMLIFMILRIKSYTIIFHFKDYPSAGGKNVSFISSLFSMDTFMKIECMFLFFGNK